MEMRVGLGHYQDDFYPRFGDGQTADDFGKLVHHRLWETLVWPVYGIHGVRDKYPLVSTKGELTTMQRYSR